MITKKDYIEFKPYWDYQRKVEYNREQLEDKLYSVEDYFVESQPEMFEQLWNLIDPEEYETPPRAWIPKNTQYQVEGETSGLVPEIYQ